MPLPSQFRAYAQTALPKLQAAWETFREVIPPCTERDEKLHFAKQSSTRGSGQQQPHGVSDTEMAMFGGMDSGEGGGGGGASAYTSFGGEEGEGGGGMGPDKMNGGLVAPGEEYGFAEEMGGCGEGGEMGDPRHKISEWQAGWNVTNAIQGMFIVSLPYAVKNGGYWGLIAMVGVAYICCHTGKILVECLYEEEGGPGSGGKLVRVRGSYVAIAEVCFGRKYGGRIVHLAQMIELLMTCILYVVLCGDLMIGSYPGGALDQQSWMMFCGIFLLPCAFLKSLRSVSFLSFWNTVAHLVINILIIGYCVTCAADWAWRRVQVRIDIFTFPISLGIVVFSYTSHIFLPTLEGNLRDRSTFNCMLDWSHLAAAIFKATFAYVAFLTWAEDTEEVITNNLTSGFKVFINFVLVVKALLSYPLPYYAAIDLLETSFFAGRAGSSSTAAKTTPFPSCYALDGMLKVWALALRLLVVFFTIMMAISIPHFAILMGFIGSFTGTMLSFVWPAYFHLRLKWDTLQWWVISLDVFIICLGAICGSIGIYYSGRALKKAYNIKLPHMM